MVPTLAGGQRGVAAAFRRVTERMAGAIPNSHTVFVGGGHFIDPGDPEVLKFVGNVLAH